MKYVRALGRLFPFDLHSNVGKETSRNSNRRAYVRSSASEPSKDVPSARTPAESTFQPIEIVRENPNVETKVHAFKRAS